MTASEAAVGRAFVVTNRLPYPLDDGWKRRTFHVVRGLGRDRPVTLLSLHEGGRDDVTQFREAVGIDIRIRTVRPPRFRGAAAAVLGAFTATPYHVWRQRSRELHRAVRSEFASARFDVAVATLSHLDPYIRDLPCPRIIDTHNIDSLVLRRYSESLRGLRSWYARRTASRLDAHEATVFGEADMVLVCSDTERELIHRAVPGARVEVVPNGVDSSNEFLPAEGATDPDLITFFGRLDYYPNADAVNWFVNDVFPLVLDAEPATRLLIIGPGAGGTLKLLEKTHPNVRFAGVVDDLRGTVGRSALVAVPLRMGGGTRLKILEALSLARAVVSTSIGAEGLELTPGHDIALADDARRFAEEVVRLIRDPASAQELGRRGRETVKRLYDWSIIEERTAQLASGLTRRSRR